MRFHHCAEQQRLGRLRAEHLGTDSIPADALTKPLAAEAHVRHRKILLGLERLRWSPLDARKSEPLAGSSALIKPGKLVTSPTTQSLLATLRGARRHPTSRREPAAGRRDPRSRARRRAETKAMPCRQPSRSKKQATGVDKCPGLLAPQGKAFSGKLGT